ncbi:MAG: DUF1272 domain-containing protein [Gammaproteobacteria bacterium]|nr:hypothetical protein [Gammaproteobacteria bacterium]MDP6097528.1 DUF1272 domain-containing protein [Gammaproteobacteria bacterium]
MLELKSNCEHCNCELPADSEQAYICSFECTFCQPCAENSLHHTCPNCGGELLRRPTRPASLLEKFPAGQKSA